MNEMCVKIFNSEHYNTNDTKNIVLSEEAGGGEVERGGGINSIGGEVEVVLNVQSFVHIRVYLVYMNIREYSHNLTGIGGRRGGGGTIRKYVLYVHISYVLALLCESRKEATYRAPSTEHTCHMMRSSK